MERIIKKNVLMGIALAILLVALPTTLAGPEVPKDVAAVEGWWTETIKPLEARKADLDPNLVTADASPVLITVRADGSGQFKTVQEAVDSVKKENTVRTVIDIGPGVYKERIKIERFKPYITFIGDPKDKPKLSADGTALKYGTVDSASVIVEADYFVAYNIIFENTAPRPTGETIKGQAVALRLSGEKATLYNCRMIGFQDTLCDDKGMHLFKDCYIEGTVDYIFGSGTSIYLNCEMHVIPGDAMAMITAQARNNEQENTGYVFIHGSVTGTGGIATLGRSWMPAPKVMFFCVQMADAVNPGGWSDNSKPETQKTVYFAEWENKGPGADLTKRVPYMKKMTEAEAKPFMTLDYIGGMKWILPPPEAKGAAAGAPGAAAGAPGAAAGGPGAAAGAPGAAAGAPGAATGAPGAAAGVPAAATGAPAASK